MCRGVHVATHNKAELVAKGTAKANTGVCFPLNLDKQHPSRFQCAHITKWNDLAGKALAVVAEELSTVLEKPHFNKASWARWPGPAILVLRGQRQDNS